MLLWEEIVRAPLNEVVTQACVDMINTEREKKTINNGKLNAQLINRVIKSYGE